MARTNRSFRQPAPTTHEGGAADRIPALLQLRRSVLATFLWEDGFYEDGEGIADRIMKLALTLPPSDVADLAIEARKVHNLRHVPLLLLKAICRTGAGTQLVGDTIATVISRADELAEFLAVYWRLDGRDLSKGQRAAKAFPVSSQAKRGLGMAFGKFGEYALAKYNRPGVIKLADVLRIARPKPKDEAQAELWRKLRKGELSVPDTWEVALSGGADKGAVFTRMLKEGTLGYFALLRNLRNMVEADVDYALVADAIRARGNGADKVLPFRYIAAMRAAPSYTMPIDDAFQAALAELPAWKGRTVVLIDVSGSMDSKLSGKSDMMQIDAAAALGAIVPGDKRVFTFSERTVEVPAHRGLSMINAIIGSQGHGGTRLVEAIQTINKLPKTDRLIVITDEQHFGGWRGSGSIPGPAAPNAYMINVANAQNGVGYKDGWTHIDGFSEGVIRYISAIEAEGAR